MSTLRSTLAEWARIEVVPSRTARQVMGVLGFAVAMALSAKVLVPLPGTPVPFTFQPMVVLLSGALLGSRLGALSQLAYLAGGIAGLPAFAFGGGVAYLMGPTGGYLLAYPAAAWVVGRLVAAGMPRICLALLAGLGVIYAGGVSWLAAFAPAESAVALGLAPFLLADLVKVLMATVIVGRLRPRALERF